MTLQTNGSEGKEMKLRSFGGQIVGSYKLHSKSAPIIMGELIPKEWFTPTGLIRKPKK